MKKEKKKSGKLPHGYDRKSSQWERASRGHSKGFQVMESQRNEK
jgi:hypothetical protein